MANHGRHDGCQCDRRPNQIATTVSRWRSSDSQPGRMRWHCGTVTHPGSLYHCCCHTFFPGPLGSSARLLLVCCWSAAALPLVCCWSARSRLLVLVCSSARPLGTVTHRPSAMSDSIPWAAARFQQTHKLWVSARVLCHLSLDVKGTAHGRRAGQAAADAGDTLWEIPIERSGFRPR